MKKKILVIDDEVNILKVTKSRLEANGYDVFTAFDGEGGLAQAKEVIPDLIIADIMMPKMDGYTFVKELKSNSSLKNTPIIIFSAKDKMKDLFEIEGIRDYLVKPFSPEELIEKVTKYI